jgi:hypothetical protein
VSEGTEEVPFPRSVIGGSGRVYSMRAGLQHWMNILPCGPPLSVSTKSGQVGQPDHQAAVTSGWRSDSSRPVETRARNDARTHCLSCQDVTRLIADHVWVPSE